MKNLKVLILYYYMVPYNGHVNVTWPLVIARQVLPNDVIKVY